MGGITGVLVIIIVVLVISGISKLPELGTGLGRAIRSFRRSVSEPDEIDVTPRQPPKPESKDAPGGEPGQKQP